MIPQLLERHPERLRERARLVAAAEADRRLSLGEQSDRLRPLVPQHRGGHEPLVDQAPQKARACAAARESKITPSGVSTWAPLDSRNAIRQYAVVSPPFDPPVITIGCREPPGSRPADGSELRPRSRRGRPASRARACGTKSRRRSGTVRCRRCGRRICSPRPAAQGSRLRARPSSQPPSSSSSGSRKPSTANSGSRPSREPRGRAPVPRRPRASAPGAEKAAGP